MKVALAHATVDGLIDELEKIANPLMLPVLLGQAAGGAVDIGMNGPWTKGGRSPAEVMADAKLQDARTPRQRKRLMKEQRNAQMQAENVGSPLASAGMLGGGLLGAKQFGKSLVRGEAGLTTNAGDLNHLHATLGGDLPRSHIFRGDDIGQAMNIPKGGILPKFMRPLEKYLYDQRGIPKDVYEKGWAQGAVVAPANAGPHVAAHEFGHQHFGSLPVGQLVRKLRLPLGVGGGIASSYMAGTGDPDSMKSKLAPVVGAASVAPILGEEAYASYKGLQAMKNSGRYTAQQLTHGRNQLLKALGTYGSVLGAAAVATPYAIRKLRQHNVKRRSRAGLPKSWETSQKIREM